MTKDARYYGKLTLDFPDHPKILPLSDAAFRCLVEATLWSCQHQTDGWLASRLAVARWGVEVLTELCTNDLSNPSLIEVENGWMIHDFAEHQSTKADIEARRQRAVIAGQQGGLAKAKRTAKRTVKRVASKPLSKNVAEIEIENTSSSNHRGGVTERNGVTAEQKTPQNPHLPPDPFCPQHMPSGTAAPCGACGYAKDERAAWIKTRDTAAADAAEATAATERAEAAHRIELAIRECQLCDEDGYRGALVCDHVDRASDTATGRAAAQAALAELKAKRQPHPPPPVPADELQDAP